MGWSIESGVGVAYEAAVNEQGMLTTSSVRRGLNFYANRNGDFYSSTIITTPTTSGSCFYYIKNIGEPDLIIQRVSVHVASNETLRGYLNDTGIPIGGSNYIPISRNGGSNRLCDCNVKYGSNITGLDGGNHFDSFHVPADDMTHTYRWEAGIMIPKNRTFTLCAVNGNIEIDFTVTAFCCADL